jgi:AcrR family transcriptional regulator
VARILSQDDVDAFRQRLCAVAERLFAQRGFEGVSFRVLADELGVSRMTPYRYFRDKAEIFAVVRTAAYQRFATSQEKGGADESDPAARLLALGKAYVDFALAEPHAYRLMFELGQPDPDGHPELREAELRAWAPLREAVRAAVEAGRLRGDVDLLAHGFWAGVHGLVSLQLAGKLAHGLGLAQLVEPVLLQLVSGCSAIESRIEEESS